MKELLYRVYQNPKKMKMLKIINDACVYFCAAFFGIELLLMLLEGSYTDAVIVGASAMLGFVIVSALRAALNRPRPYEVYDFYEIKPGEREGKSFPSRHCFSAFVIATLSFAVSPFSAIGVLIMAITIAVCRVLTGIHFVRDCAVGALIGVAFGIAGLLLVYYI